MDSTKNLFVSKFKPAFETYMQHLSLDQVQDQLRKFSSPSKSKTEICDGNQLTQQYSLPLLQRQMQTDVFEKVASFLDAQHLLASLPLVSKHFRTSLQVVKLPLLTFKNLVLTDEDWQRFGDTVRQYNFAGLRFDACNISDEVFASLLSEHHDELILHNTRKLRSLKSLPRLRTVAASKCHASLSDSALHAARSAESACLLLDFVDDAESGPKLAQRMLPSGVPHSFHCLQMLALINSRIDGLGRMLPLLPSLHALFLGGSEVSDDFTPALRQCDELRLIELTYHAAAVQASALIELEAREAKNAPVPTPHVIDFLKTQPKALTLASLGFDAGSPIKHALRFAANCTDKWNRTPLHYCALENNEELAASLIDLGCDLEMKDKRGCTPLMRAAENGRTKIVRWLVDAGADVTTKSHGLETPLFVACLKGQAEVVEVLLKTARRPEVFRVPTLYHAGWSPAMAAATNGNLRILELLVQFDVLLSHVSLQGYTPLHVAVRRGFVEGAKTLLDAKVDVNAGMPHILRVAPRKNQAEIAALLKSAGARAGAAREQKQPSKPHRSERKSNVPGATQSENASAAAPAAVSQPAGEQQPQAANSKRERQRGRNWRSNQTATGAGAGAAPPQHASGSNSAPSGSNSAPAGASYGAGAGSRASDAGRTWRRKQQ